MYNQQEIAQGKTTAIVSYLTFIGLLISWSMNQESKNKFAAFHMRQSLGLIALYFIFMISTSYLGNLFISGGFFVFFFVLWVYALYTASKGLATPVPIVGIFFQKIFKSKSWD